MKPRRPRKQKPKRMKLSPTHFTPRPFKLGAGRVPNLAVLARGVRTSRSLITHVLNGRRRISAMLLMKWSAFLGISAEQLWLRLYGERGVVPAGSPVSKFMARERMPRFVGKGEVA